MSQSAMASDERRGERSGPSAKPSLPPSGDAALFRKLFELPPLQRILLIKRGVPARWFVQVSGRLAMPKDRLYRTIGVAKATITRRSRGNEKLDRDESERAIAMMVLLGQLESIVAESGPAEGFDAASWMSGWLDTAQPALGGQRPGELMDTADGRGLVSDLLARMQSGAYA